VTRIRAGGWLLVSSLPAGTPEIVREGGADLILRLIEASAGDSAAGITRTCFCDRLEAVASCFCSASLATAPHSSSSSRSSAVGSHTWTYPAKYRQEVRVRSTPYIYSTCMHAFRDPLRTGADSLIGDGSRSCGFACCLQGSWKHWLHGQWWVGVCPEEVLRSRLLALVEAMAGRDATEAQMREILPQPGVLLHAAARTAVAGRMPLVAELYTLPTFRERAFRGPGPSMWQIQRDQTDLVDVNGEPLLHVATRAAVVSGSRLCIDERTDHSNALAALRDLLDHGADPSLCSATGTGSTALHVAVLSAFREILAPHTFGDAAFSERIVAYQLRGRPDSQIGLPSPYLQRVTTLRDVCDVVNKMMDGLVGTLSLLLERGADPNAVAVYPCETMAEVLGIAAAGESPVSTLNLTPLRLLILASQATIEHLCGPEWRPADKIMRSIARSLMHSSELISRESAAAEALMMAGAYVGGHWVTPSEGQRLCLIEKMIVLQGLCAVTQAQWFAFALSAHSRAGANSHPAWLPPSEDVCECDHRSKKGSRGGADCTTGAGVVALYDALMMRRARHLLAIC
jgi:hypothetical protein